MQNVDVSSKALFEIDDYLDKLVQKIELLSYINPTNIEEQKDFSNRTGITRGMAACGNICTPASRRLDV